MEQSQINSSVVAGADSSWMIRVKTLSAGGPYTISFKEVNTITLTNVLIGDVFLCSGQSNMEMNVSGGDSQKVDFSIDRIVNAKPSKPIRVCHVPIVSSEVPVGTARCKWYQNTHDVVAKNSAVAYYFAETMNNALDVPIGIIVACCAGVPIETYMSKESMEKCGYPIIGGSSTLYNGQIVSIMPFSLKGIIWYQGESNRDRYEQYSEQYSKLQTEYVNMMRNNFQSPDAGFYFVQIAPYPYGNQDDFLSDYFCETQALSLKTISHSDMVTTVDIGDKQTIHPHRKLEVGQRLAYIALAKDYGYDELEAEAPTYKGMSIDENKIKIEFEGCKKGLYPYTDTVTGFEIAGEDRVFHKAVAFRHNVYSVIVSSDEVKNPVAVRYCFRNYQCGNLTNLFGIPVGPFRTDNWSYKN